MTACEREEEKGVFMRPRKGNKRETKIKIH
jgi:hypothetical protein